MKHRIELFQSENFRRLETEMNSWLSRAEVVQILSVRTYACGGFSQQSGDWYSCTGEIVYIIEGEK